MCRRLVEKARELRDPGPQLGQRHAGGVGLKGVSDRPVIPDQPVGFVEARQGFGPLGADIADDRGDVVQLVGGGDQRGRLVGMRQAFDVGVPGLGNSVIRAGYERSLMAPVTP